MGELWYQELSKFRITGGRVMKLKTLLWKICNFPNLARGYLRCMKDNLGGATHPKARLYMRVLKYDDNGNLIDIENLGLVSVNVITDAGVAFIVDAFQGLVTLSNMKYHASGTGTNPEAVGNTALQTEVGTRVAGTQGEGASANIYSTVGLLSYSSSFFITEHGLFSASSGGVLFDRSVFAAKAVDANTKLEVTYQVTLSSGG